MDHEQGLPTVRIGEIVEASTARVVAQCYRLYDAPPLGALVRAGSPQTYAVVSSITTQALDPGRPVIPRGEAEETEEDILRNNPQLSRLLCTRFEAVVVGHMEGETLRHYPPPLPPHIHTFVYCCGPEEVARFTQSTDFLHTLVASGLPNLDDVVAACLRQAGRCHSSSGDFLVRAGKALALELAGQLPRLNAILRRLSG